MKNLEPPIEGDEGYPLKRHVQIHVEDEWLVKIGDGYTADASLRQVRICEVRTYTVMLQNISTAHGFGNFDDMTRRWYKLSDVEWVELTKSKV